jgi:hypothetical protein
MHFGTVIVALLKLGEVAVLNAMCFEMNQTTLTSVVHFFSNKIKH